jgi:hypothetical protein
VTPKNKYKTLAWIRTDEKEDFLETLVTVFHNIFQAATLQNI